jgi:Response regulator of the LytR/AlgR family
MKIVICDDDKNEIAKIKSNIITHSINHEIIEFTSPIMLLRYIETKEQFDLLFLDIQMPDADGWQIAKQLKESKTKIYIAMITVMGDYIYNCFDRVDWFAAKPVSIEKLHMILDNAQNKLFPTVLNFQRDNISIRLTAPEISYIEVSQNNLFIHTTSEVLKIRMTITEVKTILSNVSRFVQTHRSYIVNLDYYNKMNKMDIILSTGAIIPLSRGNKKNFLKSLGEYIRSN